MLNIAVTGGIGSGKSTVTRFIREAGFTVIDADEMARDITSAGGKAMPYIKEHFGPGFINEDGSLNRKAMRDLVFRDPSQKAVLEAGTTKVVLEDIEKIKAEKAGSGEKALFFEIPLLFETGTEGDYDRVWTVTADYETRAARIAERDNTDPAIIELIMDSQADEESKIQKSDYVILNNGTLEELRCEVAAALRTIY